MQALQKFEFQSQAILAAGIQKQINLVTESFQSLIKLKPKAQGYRLLFVGNNHSAYASAAKHFATTANKDIYRVDLSIVISKYIGETEKNLNTIFEKSSIKNWVLFFDEADALFGKRTGVRDAHDRFANQEVSYLLAKMEEYNGITILATNLKSNIDTAFIRRFHGVIDFAT